jgi:RNA binding exosome subunit
MNIKNIVFRTLVHGTESEERVITALMFASGSDGVQIQKTSGHFQNEIIILSLEISEKRKISALLGRLKDAGLIDKLISEADQRTDDECMFHFRLDKQEAYLEKLSLAKNEDVIACAIKILAYPAKRKNAVKSITETFGNFID